MAKKKETYEKEILVVIKKHKICFIQDIFCHYGGCGSRTFYQHKLQESQTLKDALEKNKTAEKKELREKWKASDAPALQMGLYKLLGADDERKRLSQTYTELSTKNDKPLNIGINWIEPDGGGE